jgi:hypothetical protein
MKQSIHFNHNGVQVSKSGLVVHGKTYPMQDIKSFRIAESNTLSSVGVLFMLLGLLLLVEEEALFVLGGFLLVAGVLMRFAHDPAYSLLLTTSDGEKSVLRSKDTLYINKILRALEVSMTDHWQESEDFDTSYDAASLSH